MSHKMRSSGRGSCLVGTMVLVLVVPVFFLEAGYEVEMPEYRG